MTRKEKRWCLSHAKKHAVSALDEVLTEEHHSLVTMDGKPRGDLHSEVMLHLEAIYRMVRRYTPERKAR